jgi:hypothetical protein
MRGIHRGEGDLPRIETPPGGRAALRQRLIEAANRFLALRSEPDVIRCGISGHLVGDLELPATWGGSQVHRACGEAAFTQEYR